ncbi:MAG: DUF2752 domain-containing protein [Leptolyngbya sp. SIO3F4]|nr:DUF2752 domain-containing protein [Leptolyngbya sp. SIO3F4]
MALSKSAVYLRIGLLGALSAPLLIVILHQLGYEATLWGCPLKALVGIPCPTWGMTRAMFAIANAQWSIAIQYHLLAPVVAILWVMAMAQVSLEIFTRRVWSRWWQCRRFWLSGLIILFGYHSYRLYGLWTSGALAADMQHSLLSHLI